MPAKGAPEERMGASLLMALCATLLAAYDPLALALPSMRTAQSVLYGGGLLLALSAGSSTLRDRLLHAPRNWARFPVRSLLEWLVWLAAVTAAQRSVLSAPIGACVAALSGYVLCCAGDEATRLAERLWLVRGARTYDMSSPTFFSAGEPLAPPGAPLLSMAEVARHASPTDCWSVLDGAVLDLTAWAPKHPGGAMIITSLGGRDLSDQFKAFHGTSMGPRLRAMCVGRLDEATAEPPSAAQLAFRGLREGLRARGEFAYPLSRTLRPALIPLVLMAGAVGCVRAAAGAAADAALLGLAALGGGLCGAAWQQMSLFGHDLGHGNVTGSWARDTVLGLALVPFFGIGFSWWKATHNTHHVVTNSESHDPDIQHMPVFAISPHMLGGFFSHYHQRDFGCGRATRGLLSLQHWLYYPIMAVAKVNLWAQTHIYLANKWQSTATATLETLGMLAHYALLGCALHALPGLAARAAFLLCALGAAGMLHVQITLSHFPMETHQGVAYQSNERSWWHMQLAGTIDVSCPPAMDWFHGGLQYQTVHHLFPRLPRFALRRVSADVDTAAKACGLTYHTSPFFELNAMVLRTLRKTAELCAAAPEGVSPGAPLLWDAVNARG